MITNNEMQLKALLKDLSTKYGITPQATLQMYCLERLLDRIAISQFRNYFIVKGGFLIASILGIGIRSTMDIDVTVKGFDDKMIPILAYPLENVFAEKLDTIISRGVANTRTRDFYDVYTLYALKKKDVNFETLRIALEATSRRRNTFKILEDYPQILESIKVDLGQYAFWRRFVAKNPYARGITLSQAVDCVQEMLDLAGISRLFR